MTTRSVLALVALLAAAASSGCDNPACVFAGTCQDGPGGTDDPMGPAGGLGAGSFPSEGDFLSVAAPEFVAAAPADGATLANVSNTTPIFVQFSESLDPGTLSDAFRLFDPVFGTDFPVVPTLVGDGRVVALIPSAQLLAGRSYQVFFTETQGITDLNGQALEADATQALTTFTIALDNSAPPQAFYVYPNDFSTTDSDTSEIVVGFDRQMDASTINDSSFIVTVDGADPAFDPAPETITGFSFPGVPQENRIWRWIPRDGDGRVQPYGTDVRVELQLSPNASPILSDDGDELPLTESEFRTVQFSLPSSVIKVAGALPEGAFGRTDVLGQNALVQVDLSEPAPSSTNAEIFMFGTSPSNSTLVRSTHRSIELAQGTTTFTLTADQLGLLDGAGDVQFLDGRLSIAIGLRRNTLRSAVRIIDADPSTPEIDRFAIDTTAPTLLGLGALGGSTATFDSSLADLVLVGRASEPVRFAFVDAGASGTNGGSALDPPETAFAAADPGTGEAIFVCAPVPVGRLDPNGAAVSYDLTIYDQALNAASIGAVGDFRQLGVVGPGAAPTGATVRVRVLDADSLLPIEGATVYSHQETGGAVTFVGSGATGADGRVDVAGAAVDATVITAEAPGYDLTTFHGVPRDAVDILVRVTNRSDAGVSGEVFSDVPFEASGQDDVVADSRATLRQRLSATGSEFQDSDSARFVNPFGPVRIRPDAIGALSFVATQQDVTQGAYVAQQYLSGFALLAPLTSLSAGAFSESITVDGGTALLSSPASLVALGLPTQGLATGGLSGLGTLTDAPQVTVEAAGVGMDGPLVVGRGVAFDQGGGAYVIQSALAGLAGPVGALASRGAIDPDVFVRVAAVDDGGNEAIARPRLSDATGGVLTAIGVPQLLTPGPGGNTGGTGFNLQVQDTLADGVATDGIVQVVLTDANGRRWEVWGLDTNDAAGDLLLSVPDVVIQGGTGLASGLQTVETTLYGGPFDRGHFLYTDLERFHTVQGYAAPVTIQVP